MTLVEVPQRTERTAMTQRAGGAVLRAVRAATVETSSTDRRTARSVSPVATRAHLPLWSTRLRGDGIERVPAGTVERAGRRGRVSGDIPGSGEPDPGRTVAGISCQLALHHRPNGRVQRESLPRRTAGGKPRGPGHPRHERIYHSTRSPVGRRSPPWTRSWISYRLVTASRWCCATSKDSHAMRRRPD